MNNSQLYNHFRLSGIPSPLATQAADAISEKYDEFLAVDSLNAAAVLELANDFIKLYAIEGDESLETLKAKLV